MRTSRWGFHRTAYYLYRKHWARSPIHPMTALLVAGLLVNLSVRVLESVLNKREAT